MKEKDKKIHIPKVLIFWKTYFYCQSQEFLLKHYLYIIYFSRNFTLSNSIILVENLIRGKRALEIFLIDHCASDIGNKSTAEKYLKNLASMSPTQY